MLGRVPARVLAEAKDQLVTVFDHEFTLRAMSQSLFEEQRRVFVEQGFEFLHVACNGTA